MIMATKTCEHGVRPSSNCDLCYKKKQTKYQYSYFNKFVARGVVLGYLLSRGCPHRDHKQYYIWVTVCKEHYRILGKRAIERVKDSQGECEINYCPLYAYKSIRIAV